MDSQEKDFAGKLTKPKRNNYYYAKLLEVEHFCMEQGYFNRKRWLLNALSLGEGVLVGLQVTVKKNGEEQDELCINPGMAVDAWGREVVVPVETFVDPWQLTDETGCPQGDPLNQEEDHDVSICLVYKECDDDYAPVHASNCHTSDLAASTVVESYRVLVKEGKTQEPEGIDRLCAALRAVDRRMALVDVLATDHNPSDGPPCVPLATVHLQNGGSIGYVTPTTRLLYSNEILLEMILCLAARIEECCQGQQQAVVLDIEHFSGPPQKPEPGTEHSIEVRVFNAADVNKPGVDGVTIKFEVTSGGGVVGSVGSEEKDSYKEEYSEDGGFAQVEWTLGPDEGMNTLDAMILPSGPQVTFQAEAKGGGGIPPIILDIERISVEPQEPEPGTEHSIEVRVFNAADVNKPGVDGVTIKFEVTSGGGVVGSVGSKEKDSYKEEYSEDGGFAQVEWTLGPDEGMNTLDATILPSGPPVTFHAEAKGGEVQPNVLLRVSEDNQTGTSNTPLPELIQVQVISGVDGSPVQGEQVTFIASGDGSVDPETFTTLVNGLAKTEWTLGPTIGKQTLRASIASGAEVGFQATAEAPAPQPSVLTISSWQAPSTLNPYLSNGKKEMLAASLVLEPLACYDDNGQLVPVLAEEIPSWDNGGVFESAGRTVIIWKLLRDVKWSDGTPFTAADVVFTYDYCKALIDYGAGCSAANRFADVESVVAEDDLTVTIAFSNRKAWPYGPFVSFESPILPEHQFGESLELEDPYTRPENFAPVGTGPYTVVEFAANEQVAYEANNDYRNNVPHFDQAVFSNTDGDAKTAAIAIQTGESHYIWNLHVEPWMLDSLINNPEIEVMAEFGTAVECLMINLTDPDPASGNPPSEYPSQHPLLKQQKVRHALALVIDRDPIIAACYSGAKGLYGSSTFDLLYLPPSSPQSGYPPDIDRANQLLEEAGCTLSEEGLRLDPDGNPWRVDFQTSCNSVRQDTQERIAGQWWNELGVETIVGNPDASIFFGGDPSEADTTGKFYADIQLFTIDFTGTDPEIFVLNWSCAAIARRANQWLGRNVPRYCNESYEANIAQLATKGGDADRVILAKKIVDELIAEYVVIPLVHRKNISAHTKNLKGIKFNSWDSEFWNIADWFWQ